MKMIQSVMKIMLLLWVLIFKIVLTVKEILITKDHLSAHTAEKVHILVILTIHITLIIVVVIVHLIHQFMKLHLFKNQLSVKHQFQDNQQVN